MKIFFKSFEWDQTVKDGVQFNDEIMGSHRCNDQDKKYIFKNQDMPEYLDSTWRNSFCMDDPS